MDLIIKQEVAQAILNYLAEKPYKDVFMMVMELQRLQPAILVSTPTPDVKKQEGDVEKPEEHPSATD